MSETVQLVECPRDAMQGWHRQISTTEKIGYLNNLLKVGFSIIDCGSFVSPKAIPQMSDTSEVLAGVDKTGNSQLLVIVANTRGAVEACEQEKVDVLGFPFSISETFQQRNANSSIADALTRLKEIRELTISQGKKLVAYLSMGFGNPYGDVYNDELVFEWAEKLKSLEVDMISLADTIGAAEPAQIFSLCKGLIASVGSERFGLHLHSTPNSWHAKVSAAWEAGCKRFDGALLGIGGCPMASDELTGNLNTLNLVGYFMSRNVLQPLNHLMLERAARQASEIFTKAD